MLTLRVCARVRVSQAQKEVSAALEKAQKKIVAIGDEAQNPQHLKSLLQTMLASL